MKHLVLTVIVLFICIHKSIQEGIAVIKVTIYYESLCPYSTAFITRQFYPGYKNISSHLKMDFVPYGNADHGIVKDKWVFECQHGTKECWGNKAHACGIAENKGQDETVDYVHCMMKHKKRATTKAVKDCAVKLGVEGEALLKCIEERGDVLLAEHGDRTHAEKELNGVPVITFNDVSDAATDADSMYDFIGTVCKRLPEKPPACEK